jgi:hypothetical protein
METRCITCRKYYDQRTSDAELLGFCSNKCVHTRAHQLGYRKFNKPLKSGPMRRAEYVILTGRF